MDPRRVMLDLNISEADLIDHWKAHDSYSRNGNESALKGLSDDTRNKAMKLYRTLRDVGILPYKPVEGKMKFYIIADYYYCWKVHLRNLKDRPAWQYLSLEDVHKLLDNSIAQVKKQMDHRPKLWEDGDQKVKSPPLINEVLAEEMNLAPSTPGPKFSKEELEKDIPF
jgi:hypothetical protein